MTKVAVVLSGCGFLDGAEIRESVLSLLYLDQQGADVEIFAPDIPQADVVNHLTGKPEKESRNVLVESARIARGNIKPLAEADAGAFDALVLPGGFGVAKNLSDFAAKGEGASVLPEVKRLITAFLDSGKPVGAVCISPAVLVAAVGKGRVTIGHDAGTAAVIEALGGHHVTCDANEAVLDEALGVVSCPAYMLDAPLSQIAAGIEAMVKKLLARAAKNKTKAA